MSAAAGGPSGCLQSSEDAGGLPRNLRLRTQAIPKSLCGSPRNQVSARGVKRLPAAAGAPSDHLALFRGFRWRLKDRRSSRTQAGPEEYLWNSAEVAGLKVRVDNRMLTYSASVGEMVYVHGFRR